MRTVVVGASSGLGRCIAADLGQRGNQVALLARRKDRLDDAVREAGDSAVAIACDVTEPSSCTDAIEEAASTLGGIDSLLYASGIGDIVRLVDADADLWSRTFATNVTGAALITSAAIPHLTKTSGVVAYLSSMSASLTDPWPGLGPYIVSKAALDKLVQAFRIEHPEIGFTRVVIGNCGGGEGDSMSGFNAGWDMDVTMELVPKWVERGLVGKQLVDITEVLRVVHTVLSSGATASIDTVAIAPRG